jgi:hypothetical protein
MHVDKPSWFIEGAVDFFQSVRYDYRKSNGFNLFGEECCVNRFKEG